MIPRPGTGGAPAPAAAYLYLLQSQSDGTCYVGWTTDPVRRLVEHNAGTSTYTSRKRPWRLIGVEPHPTVADAKAYEQTLRRSPRKLARFKKRVLNRSRLSAGPCQGVG